MTEATDFLLSDHLKTEEEVASYLRSVMEDNDPELLRVSLLSLARSEGMTEIARRSGISREGLYKSLGESGDPKFSTLCKITEALGFRLTLVPITPNKAA